MTYKEFEDIFSAERMQRYLIAARNNKQKAVGLYRGNIRVAQEMFAVVSCFEVALRNRIDRLMRVRFGEDWLRDAILPGGIFDNVKTKETQRIVTKVYNELSREGLYTHSHLLSNMEFGVWKYMFSAPQYKASGRILLSVFPSKPKSTKATQYNNSYIFNELDKINMLRNRIAHHEPICFVTGQSNVNMAYLIERYNKILRLFSWMEIDSKSLLYGLDHVKNECEKLEKQNPIV